MNDEKKYLYNVAQSAENEITGTVDLTKAEAAVVAYATNSDNWKNVNCNGGYTGSFYIDVDNPQEIESHKEGYILATISDMEYTYYGKPCKDLHIISTDSTDAFDLTNDYGDFIARIHSVKETAEVMQRLYAGEYA